MDINISRNALIILVALSGCISKQLLQNHEYDDLYYTSRDRQVLAAQKAEQMKTAPVKVEERTQPNVTNGQSDTYIYHYDSKEPKPVKQDQINNSNQNVAPNSNTNYNSNTNNNSNTPSNPADSTGHH